MCSYIFSSHKNFNYHSSNLKLKSRGPDHTNYLNFNNNYYVHNILSITGDFTPQPIINEGVAVLFNGQIYNYKDFGSYKCDTDCILPLYNKYGPNFIKKLDGEFSICIVDHNKKIILLYSDIFKTKPLFYSIDKNGIIVSTYKDPILSMGISNIKSINPSEIVEISLDTNCINSSTNYFTFDLNQHKNNFSDWNIAFTNSIYKRCNNVKNIFIGLSSGYDSGAIVAELLSQNISFTAFTHKGKENFDIIKKRHKLMGVNRHHIYKTSANDLKFWADYIFQNCDSYNYEIYSARSSYNEFNLKLHEDNGSKQFAVLCSLASQTNMKINISSVGADEIFSDYGFNGTGYYEHSNFGGLFPDNLSSVFPWPSFYGSSLASYIAKEEYVGGLFGIENRYPFLDKSVVQEFLWLESSLKNKFYKNVLHNYLTEKNYPFSVGVKIGF